MDWLIWGGTVVAFAGLAGLVWCIFRVWKARGQNLPDEEMRDLIRKMVPLNMGALMLSVIGLMAVIMGIFLG